MNNLGLATQNTKKAKLVDNFFAPVKEQLQYTLRLAIDDVNKLSKIQQNTSASNILYKLRNEYVHQGNFTGKVFKTDSTESHVYNLFSFDWGIPKNKSVIDVCAETNLTYNQFLNIYFSASRIHLENYILKPI